jgi:hypothetical protein
MTGVMQFASKLDLFPELYIVAKRLAGANDVQHRLATTLG